MLHEQNHRLYIEWLHRPPKHTSLDYLIIPIVYKSLWFILVIKHQRAIIYCSYLKGFDYQLVEKINNFLQIHKITIEDDDFSERDDICDEEEIRKTKIILANTFQSETRSDSAIYMLKYIDCITKNEPILINRNDVGYLKHSMSVELEIGKLFNF